MRSTFDPNTLYTALTRALNASSKKKKKLVKQRKSLRSAPHPGRRAKQRKRRRRSVQRMRRRRKRKRKRWAQLPALASPHIVVFHPSPCHHFIDVTLFIPCSRPPERKPKKPKQLLPTPRRRLGDSSEPRRRAHDMSLHRCIWNFDLFRLSIVNSCYSRCPTESKDTCCHFLSLIESLSYNPTYFELQQFLFSYSLQLAYVQSRGFIVGIGK